MKTHDDVNIFLTPRYLKFLIFMRELLQGKGHTVRRRMLRDVLNIPAKKKAHKENKLNLLAGVRSDVNGFLQRVIIANLSSKAIDLKELVPKEEYRYLLVKIFSDDDICESQRLEFFIVKSFRELDTKNTINGLGKIKETVQDIVSFVREIIDNLGKEEQ